MVTTFAIIENNTVVNRIVADQEFMDSLGVEYTDNAAAQIHCTLIDGVWTAPAQPEVTSGPRLKDEANGKYRDGASVVIDPKFGSEMEPPVALTTMPLE